uniref:pre-rRNA processing protein FTSJ3 n=1 Tax=Gadus morhua TaxID=8049 RepID=A0A8C5C626_GADMO
MGKKSKIGKARKDKFYHLAKETGYRSRSSFKLIQLNRKFQFLQKARALVDLCAAPGGWLQVASKFMPISSLIIGVDLVPIRAIPNVVTLQEDITTDKCKQAIRKELQTWKVDVVLNDGAPNVGANWQHDAFTQAHLTLMALKLACEFLNKGGSFITKVFRSKDYQPLLWIFQQFFKKVQATKPQASRNESAEIFVVCQGFLAPDKIDSKFFDPKHAFKEVEVQAKTVKELIPVKKPKAEGYTDGDLTLYHSFTLTEFLKAENPVDFLGKASTITLDSLELESQEITTDEVKECCRDIKVLGRKDLRLLLNWRTKLRRYLSKKIKDEAKQRDQEIVKKKKLLKERRKQRERVELKMDLPGVSIADNEDTAMFCLSSIKAKVCDTHTHTHKLTHTQPLAVSISDSIAFRRQWVQDSEEEEEKGPGGLLVDLEDKDVKRERETNLWFSKVYKRHRVLDAEGLALGCQIASSKKRGRDLMDDSFHRFANSEGQWEVPEWFFDDERKHRKKPVPVTKEMVDEFKQKWKEINARPIKRVAEAKARKKKRMLKKMESAKKKAEAVVDTVDISEKEKMSALKSIYKKAGVGKEEKREVTYVVAKKGSGGRVGRPSGVKGHFKVVDSRMKKDMRGLQRKEQQPRQRSHLWLVSLVEVKVDTLL